ncbi:MAG: cytochrome C [Betaproteobacteria bacterium]
MRPLLAVLALLVSVFVNAQPTARFEDSMAQRLLACTGCHGLQGRAAPDGFYPRLAGKPAGYLYNQLRNFQDGRRHYALMVNLLEPLSDAYLREIAEHFSKLDIPYLAPLRTPVAARVLQRGRELATEGDTVRKIPACARCHGEALMGLVPFVPGLLGLPPDYLLAQLGAWRTGGRHARSPDCMAEVAKRLAPEDVSAVVGWLAAQRVPEAAKPTTALPRPMPMACGSTAISTLAESGVAP